MERKHSKTPQDQSHSAFSRRSFLKSGGFAAGAALFMGGGLIGCADSQGGSSSAKDTGSQGIGGQNVPYKVFDTDILVIGGGLASMTATREMIKSGKRVLVVDKGPFGFSGASGMNWGAFTPTNLPYYDSTKSDADNAAFYEQMAANQANTSLDSARYLEAKKNDDYHLGINSHMNFGEVMANRNPDGTIKLFYDFPTVKGWDFVFMRRWSDTERAESAVTIHDQVMITDVFVDKGVCYGAVGIHLPSGEYRVYRSDATLLAAGGCTQFFGWITVAPKSIQSPDNTADVEMALLRRGARIGDNESAAYDLSAPFPTGVACSYTGTYGAEFKGYQEVFDKDGKAFLTDETKYDQAKLRAIGYFNRSVGQAIIDGQGSPDGGIYTKWDKEIFPHLRYFYQRNSPLLKEKFNFDTDQGLLEVIHEMYEHCGTPMIDENYMSTEITGLFCSRGAGSLGEFCQDVENNRLNSMLAAKKVVEYGSVANVGVRGHRLRIVTGAS
ncbi:MAG: FAD-dependent oxidoreductase [Raoultibacter sp.]